jgi:hypothetical protein
MSSISPAGATPPVHHAPHAKSENAHRQTAKSETQENKPAPPAAKPSPHKVDVKA